MVVLGNILQKGRSLTLTTDRRQWKIRGWGTVSFCSLSQRFPQQLQPEGREERPARAAVAKSQAPSRGRRVNCGRGLRDADGPPAPMALLLVGCQGPAGKLPFQRPKNPLKSSFLPSPCFLALSLPTALTWVPFPAQGQCWVSEPKQWDEKCSCTDRLRDCVRAYLTLQKVALSHDINISLQKKLGRWRSCTNEWYFPLCQDGVCSTCAAPRPKHVVPSWLKKFSKNLCLWV